MTLQTGPPVLSATEPNLERPQIPAGLFATVDEAAAVFRIDARTLRRAIADGQIAAVTLGRTTRIPTAELRRLAAPPD